MSFDTFGLTPELMEAVHTANYEAPTPVQSQAIPAALKGRDLVACAQTGSGKTAAYLLPILNKLSEFIYLKNKPVRALILTPTRELADQVNASVQSFCEHMEQKLRSTAVFGGVGVEGQINKLKRGMDILVATPGRLMDLEKQGHIKLNKVQFLVIDEADRMLDMGFIGDLRQIALKLPNSKQTMMFSATFGEEVRELARHLLRKPVEINAESLAEDALDIEHIAYPTLEEDKLSALIYLMRHHRWEQVVIFASTKARVNLIVEELRLNHIRTAVMHGDYTQKERIEALQAMRDGKVIALVATDVAARGIDIPALPCVIHYDFPSIPEAYVHRSGRTGRAGHSGLVISLIQGEGFAKVKEFEKDLGIKIPIKALAHFKKAPSTAARLRDEAPIPKGSARAKARPGTRDPGPKAPADRDKKNTGAKPGPKFGKPKSSGGASRPAAPARSEGGRKAARTKSPTKPGRR